MSSHSRGCLRILLTPLPSTRVARHPVLSLSLPELWPRRFLQFEQLRLLQEIAPVDDVIEPYACLASAEVLQQFLQGIGRALRQHTYSPQIARVSQSRVQFGKRIAAFQCEASRLLRAAQQVLDEQQFIEHYRCQEQPAAVDFPALLEEARAADGSYALKFLLPVDLRFLSAQIAHRGLHQPILIVEVQMSAGGLHPLEECLLLRGFLFQDDEPPVFRRQGFDQLAPPCVSRFAAFNAVDRQPDVPLRERTGIRAAAVSRSRDEEWPR